MEDLKHSIFSQDFMIKNKQYKGTVYIDNEGVYWIIITKDGEEISRKIYVGKINDLYMVMEMEKMVNENA